MFETLTRQAELVATDLTDSRRAFLGRIGRGALATAGALGALLAAPRKALCGSPTHCINQCIQGSCGRHPSQACYDANYSTCYFICTAPP